MFNEDYSEVRIVKNGSKSDGKMRGFGSTELSPMSARTGTLKTVIIEEGVINTGQYAFRNCNSITSVTVEGNTFKRVDYGSFNGCTSLETAVFPNSLEKIDSVAFHSCKKLKSVELGNSLKTIENLAFILCEKLEDIEIPSTVTKIGNQAFYHCSLIENIVIPEGVTKLGTYTFGHCAKLKSIQLPESLTEIGDTCFYACKSLESITIPKAVTKFGSNPFSCCSNLKNINLKTDAYVIIDDVLYDKDVVEVIGFLPTNLNETYSTPSTIRKIGTHSFASTGETSKLKNIYLTEGVEEIAGGAFHFRDISLLSIPSTITTVSNTAFSLSGIINNMKLHTQT